MKLASLKNNQISVQIKRCAIYSQNRRVNGMRVANVTGFEGCTSPLPNPIKVVGMGSVGMDYLAQVAQFPQPDDKLRTERLELQGGGNAGNALTAAARLGLSPTLISKIGDDSLGDAIISELESDIIDTSLIIRATGSPSPFTYIIVDRQAGTRTCIHTPSSPMTPEETTPQLAAAALTTTSTTSSSSSISSSNNNEKTSLVYFDGRLTEAALVLAKAARKEGIPVLVEAERLRPGLDELIQCADYIVTSAHFPEAWTGEGCLGDALVMAFSRLPDNVKWMVTTLGKRGAVVLERNDSSSGIGIGSSGGGGCIADDLIHELFTAAAAGNVSGDDNSDNKVVCINETGNVSVRLGSVAKSDGPVRLTLKRSEDRKDVLEAAQAAAATAAAAANGDSGSGNKYASASTSANGNDNSSSCIGITAQVTVVQAAKLSSLDNNNSDDVVVVDTTGAGDAFIGSLLYGICTGKNVVDGMKLGSVVAACKCTQLGARPGLPRRNQLHSDVL